MGKKRKKSSSSNTRNSRKKKSSSIDLAVIGTFIVGVLLTILVYAETGTLGQIISPVLGGVIGIIKYVVPLGMIGISISLARNDKDYLVSKICQYVVFLSCIAAMMSIFQVSKGNLNMDMKFSEVLERAYTLGTTNIGGGTIGTVIAYPLITMLGMFGAAVATTGIAIIMLVFTFGLKPAEFVLEILDALEERKEQRNLERESLHEERIAHMREQNQLNQEQRKKRKELQQEQKLARKRKKLKSTDFYEIEEEEPEIDDSQITINLNRKKEKNREEEKPEPEKVEFNIFHRKSKAVQEVELEEEPEPLNPNELESNLFVQKAEEKEEKVKEVLQLEHNTIVSEDENYETPPVEFLKQGEEKSLKGGKKALANTATKLQKTLYSFGVSAKVENVSVGPAITRYELKPAEGVRVSKIAKLSDDIALNLAAESIRIEAPIPGKQAVGIEIPNSEKEVVHLRDIIESTAFEDAESKVSVALGKDIGGEPVIADIGKMPHVLIAGSTGSGKSVCINTLITSIIYKAKPSEVKLVMVDPKVVELSVYNGIPHLLIPVVTDARKAAGALAWAVQEMENRYQLFATKGVRDLKGYNAAAGEEEGKLPQIVIIIDELADLMMVAAKEVEDSICRLAQKARAAGMHLVIATQRPSVDVITGIIKANIPSRIAFAVSSQIDSRTILDMVGAEKLLGKGDMLFYPIGSSKPTRVQCAFVSDGEVEKVVDFLKSNNGEVVYNEDILEEIEKSNKSDRELEETDDEDDTDPFLEDAIKTVVEVGQASTSFIQRRFKVGYARAGRIIDQMEARGVISGYEGSKPRQVLITMERLQELSMAKPESGENNA